jgi:hypothetical protein
MVRVTTRDAFAHEEWDSLVQLPRWVVAAASAAQYDRPHKTNVEVEVGLLASAHGRDTGNAFVAAVAEQTLRIFDDRATVAGIEFRDTGAGIATVLDRVAAVNAVLRTRAEAADAAAYRAWLLSITDRVIEAVRTGDFMGVGGELVTESEHRFRDQLAEVLVG